MNAVIALCHFCEMHGPSVLFCTQSFHDADDPQRVLRQDDTNPPQSPKRHYGKAEMFQRSLSTGSNSAVSEHKSENKETEKKLSDTCEACRSLSSNVSGYISNDHEARVSYVSSQYPFHPEIFSIVRQACVRSLSCEVCPGREGPIFFGDDHRGHVYSHTFFLKDSQARGFQRWYSIVVVMMDKIFLLNSWPFLTKHIRTLIDELQEKANKIYQIEQIECPQRVVRLNNVTSMTPGNFRRQRGSSKSMRSLDELTNDKSVFAALHLWFTWLLKAGGNRMTEKLLEGPPTEDTVIDLEQQEETEEGFMLVSTKRIPRNDVNGFSSFSAEKRAQAGGDMKVKHIRHLWMILGREKFRTLAYHVLIGNQIVILCDDKELVQSIIHHLKVLLPRGCINDTPYTDVYVESWMCNLLGLPKDTAIPEQVRTSEFHLVLEISCKDEQLMKCSDPLAYNYHLSSQIPSHEKGPTILQSIEKVIENTEFTESVRELYFVSIKEEWMNKVKVLFKFSRSESRTVEDTHRFLQVLGAHERDKPILKFWMTGLSNQFKRHVSSEKMSHND